MNRLGEITPARWLAYVVVCMALAAIGWYLWTAHRAHLGGLLFFGLALACPLMHLFMHRGHGHGGHDHSEHRHGMTGPDGRN